MLFLMYYSIIEHGTFTLALSYPDNDLWLSATVAWVCVYVYDTYGDTVWVYSAVCALLSCVGSLGI